MPSLQAGGPPLIVCPQLLVQYVYGYPPYCRLFLHLKPESTPCYGDRDSRALHAMVTGTHLSWAHGNLPIQIYEEKNKIISQIYHAVSHMFLQLTPIMNLSGIKHSCVSSGDCKIPATSQHIRRFIFIKTDIIMYHFLQKFFKLKLMCSATMAEVQMLIYIMAILDQI